MARWQQILAAIASNVEDHFDALKYRLTARFDRDDPIKIVTYRGYGTQERVYLKGRVLEDQGVPPVSDNDTLWDNLLNTYRRFESDEVPWARVLVRFQGTEQEVRANEEGFFEAWLTPAEPLPADRLWHPVEVELIEPQREGYAPARAPGYVLVPPPEARFGVISDIDDTVVKTDATNLLRMARTVFLGNARTRLPFKGVAAFYKALQGGQAGVATNPLFYVSSSPWNLYDLLVEFFELQGIPIGPLLLRDWGISKNELLPTGHRSYKLGVIRQILDLFPQLPFLLIGDSGQEDPEIYHALVSDYPDRILAVYIRNVSREPKRVEAIRALAEEVVAAGSTLILGDDTLAAARHAAEQGWISPDTLPAIESEKEADEAPPSAVEKLLGEEKKAEGPTVVVEGESPEETAAAVEAGAVEAALAEGDESREGAPTVIVEGDERKEP